MSALLGGFIILSVVFGVGYAVAGWRDSSHQLLDSAGTQNLQDAVNTSQTAYVNQGITNGSRPLSPQCANFSQSSTPVLYDSTVSAPPSAFVASVTITILCNGCGGLTVSPQWSGTFGPAGNPSQSISVGGICDQSFMVDRPVGSVWNLSWSFQRLTTIGTLDVRVSLDNNQTIIFDRSSTDGVTTVSGAVSFPAQ
jgi:hypothetical protein